MDENKNIEVKRTLEQTPETEGQTEPVKPDAAASARDLWHARNNSGKKKSADKESISDAGPVYYGSAPPKKKKPWLIFAVILAVFIILGIIFSGFSGIGTSEDGDISMASDVNEDFIGVLYIEGVIGQDDDAYSQEYVIDAIDGMMNNDSNKGMILYVNTPGGGVYESDEVYLKLRDYQENTDRPLYVYMASQATSGGYYISASADKILANRNCWTGSIGVTIGTLYNISDLLDKYGIETETITSGKNKAMGSMVAPLTSQQKKIFQSLVDEAYDQFVGIVAEGRNMDVKDVRKIADGRIYTAKQAKELGLVDQVVNSYDDVEESITEKYDLDDCEIYEFRYVADYGLFESFIKSIDKLAEASSGKSDISALTELMENEGELPLQYICEVKK